MDDDDPYIGFSDFLDLDVVLEDDETKKKNGKIKGKWKKNVIIL
jgi:hypothetical protein